MIITMSVCLRSRRGSGRLAGSGQLSVGSCQEELPRAGGVVGCLPADAYCDRRLAMGVGVWL